MSKIDVNGVEVTVMKVGNEDYISLTDMLRSKDGEFFFYNWLRNHNTIEFLGTWEKVFNPEFNSAEFDIIKKVKPDSIVFALVQRNGLKRPRLLELYPRQVVTVEHMLTKISLLNLRCGLARNSKCISFVSLSASKKKSMLS